MKILHVYHHFYPHVGGIEKYIEDVCIELIKLGHTSDVCCLNANPGSSEKLAAEELYRGIRIYRLPFIDMKYYKVARDIPRLVGIARKYDIIHVYGVGFFSDFLLARKNAHGRPVVVSTVGGVFHTKKLIPVKKIYFNGWCRLILRRADRVMAISEHDRKLFSQITKNIEVIPVPVNAGKFGFSERKRSNCRMLYIGRISANKRIDRLLDMMGILGEKEPRSKLVIAGRDWEGLRKSLEEKAENLGLGEKVEFIGEVGDAELSKRVRESTFFVSASEYESFGISAVEAMAAGMIVVLNSIDSFKYFVKNGENGFVLDFSDLEKVGKLILELNGKALTEISKNARLRVSEFLPETVAKKTESLYAQVLGKRRKG